MAALGAGLFAHILGMPILFLLVWSCVCPGGVHNSCDLSAIAGGNCLRPRSVGRGFRKLVHRSYIIWVQFAGGEADPWF